MVLNDRKRGARVRGMQTGKRVLFATLVYLGFDVRKFNNKRKEFFLPHVLYDPKYTHVPPGNRASPPLQVSFPAVPRVMIFIERSEKNSIKIAE